MSKIDYFGSTDIKQHTFNGNVVHLRKLPVSTVIRMQKLSAKGDMGEDEVNIQSLAILAANGVKEWGRESEKDLMEIPFHLMEELSDLTKAILEFNGMATVDDKEAE